MRLMSLSGDQIDAVLFDYGNTLAAFGPDKVRREREALMSLLTERLGPVDRVKLDAIRDRQMLAPFRNGLRENDLATISAELVEALCERTIPATELEGHVRAIVDLRYRLFVEHVRVAEGVRRLLSALRKRYRLGIISNYPCGRCTRDSLLRNGIADLFAVVVVSADVGYVKPHALPFQAAVRAMGLTPRQCLYVGDGWLPDIQGAKRFGMQAVLTTEHLPYETFDREPGDEEPDAIIDTLGRLPALLALAN